MSFTTNSKGGEYKHTLTPLELPQHSHWIGRAMQSHIGGLDGWGLIQDGGFENYVALTPQAKGLCLDDGTGTSGSDVPHNNIQPYVVIFIWKRIK